MGNNLLEKIRKARELVVPVGGFTFTVRRPTDVEMIELSKTGPITRLLPYIIGWDGVNELDIISGGDPHPVLFDTLVAAEWLSDRPDLLMPLIEAIMQSYYDHAKSTEKVVKN